MKLEIEASALARALKHARLAVERSTIPILGHCLLEASGERLRISTSNMNMMVETVVPAIVIESGTMTAPADLLLHAVDSAPAGAQAALSVEAGRLLVRCGRSRHRLPSLDPREFPRMRDIEAVQAEFVAPLSEWLAWASPAMSSNDATPHLNGVWLSKAGGKVVIASSNSHVVFLRREDSPFGTDNLPTVLLPVPLVAVISRLFDGQVRIALDDARIDIESGGLRLAAKMADAVRPALERAVDREESARLVVDRLELLEALKQVRPYETSRPCVEMLATGGDIRLACRSDESGIGVADVPLDVAPQTPMRFAMNGNYLASLLTSTSAERVALSLDDRASIMKIAPADGWDRDVAVSLMVSKHNSEIEAALAGDDLASPSQAAA